MITKPSRTVAAIFLAVTLLYSPQSFGGSRRRAVAAPLPSDELSIAFIDTPAGVLDTGRIAATPRRGKTADATTMKTIGIRIGQPSREARGTATLRAFLEVADPHCIVKVNGVVLGPQARVVRRQVPIGVPSAHRIEIQVPATAPEGVFAADIHWEVTTN